MKHVAKELKDTVDISRGVSPKYEFAKLLVLLGVAFVVGYAVLGVVADTIAEQIPERLEAKLFAGMEAHAPKKGFVAEKYQRAEQLFERLVRAGSLRPLPYKLLYVDINEPNAFAIPGGGVGVTRGLLELVEHEEGLAMVLGHELGHQQKRHVLRSIGRSLIWAVIQAYVLEESSGAASSLVIHMMSSAHSRAAEYEADSIGLQLASKVLGPSDSYLEFFEKIHEQYENGENRWSFLLRSHPLTVDRMKRLREEAEFLLTKREPRE